LPEVSLVAILDADKEGFLRSGRSLIQTIGRAARNVGGEVIMYADRETAAMKLAIGETNRRRVIQEAYNVEHGITPKTVIKAIMDFSPTSGNRDYYAIPKGPAKGSARAGETIDLVDQIEAVRQEMFAAAENLEFEKAARLRDQLRVLKGEGDGTAAVIAASLGGGPKAKKGPKRGGEPKPPGMKPGMPGSANARGRSPGRAR
jgi:excinuclease ABC subunit B